MAAVSQKIPNLLGGISQQPDPVKLPGQVRVADNVYLDPTFGCRKRPSTEHIARLASDVPSNAKWFPIFRDKNERYAVAIYLDSSSVPTCRVWDLNNGDEKTVTTSDLSKDYLDGLTKESINFLTVADYTLISNSSSIVSMSGDSSDVLEEEAFVVVNQVSYNTNYSIDLREAGTELTQVKVWTATGIEVSPGSYQANDGGSCNNQATTPFDISSGEKTGLRGKIINQCTIAQNGDDFSSRYSVSCQLSNGGIGFRAGDSFSVSTPGKGMTIRVTSEAFTYAYESAGTANYTSAEDSDAGPLSVTAITGGLTTAVNALDNYEAETVGNVIRIKSTNGDPFNLSVRGGSTNNAMTGIKGQASDVAELPSQGWDGTILKVNNTQDTDSDDYYVRFTTQSSGIPGAGSWEECVAPGIITTLNSSTMPQALIRNSDGSFKLEPLNSDSAFEGWAEREVGDETSNPEPSFVGKGISYMFFFANRLGFLSEDAVIMSQPGDYFNFFQTSALTISDADPIDITASSTTPAILKAAIGSPKGLILFAERSQFLMATSDVAFAASTVKMTEISQYFYKSEVLPLSTGVSVAFISENQTYSKVMEMAIDSVENRPVVAEITRIVPEYLPPSFVWGEVSPNNNMMLYGANTEEVYVFKFFNNGDKRELAGWTRWTYPAACHMFAMEDDLCHIILFDGTKHMLVRSELIDDPQVAPLDVGFSSFSPRLDLSVPSSMLTITDDPDSILDSRVAIPEQIDIADAVYTFISTDGGFKGLFINNSTKVDASGGRYIVVPKDLTSANAILGIGYETLVTLPSIFIAQEGRSDRVNIPQVSFLYLELYYSGRYEVTVKKLGYDPKVYDIEVTPANSYDANNVPLSEISTQSIPIFSSGDILNITIKAPDPFPSSITGYSWEGTYNNRGIKVIR